MMIKLMKSTFFNEEDTKKKLINFIANAEILSMSKECLEFERAFAKKQGCEYSIMVNSGSSGNLILIQALLNLGRLKKGDEIGVSALTWATNIMPLIQLGLVPIAIDCELDTLNISPSTLEPHVKNLKGLFITNVLGFSDDISIIREMCSEKGILLLEDNCESLGSRVDDKLLGNFSLASTFSFFVGHHLSTIEGGMVCTDDAELNDMLRMVRSHGWDRNLDTEKQNGLRTSFGIKPFIAKYTFYDLAYNVRPTEINGFIGNTQLPYWDSIVASRASNFHKFNEVISQNDDLLHLDVSHMDLISNFAMPVVCRNENILEDYIQKFEMSDIEIRPIIAGDMTRQPFYQKYSNSSKPCTNASFIHRNGFYFGNNPDLTDEEINKITGLLK